METFIEHVQEQVSETQRAYADDVLSYESAVMKLLYLIALILIASLKNERHELAD